MSKQDQLAEAVFNKMMSKDYCSQWMSIEAVFLKEGQYISEK